VPPECLAEGVGRVATHASIGPGGLSPGSAALRSKLQRSPAEAADDSGCVRVIDAQDRAFILVEHPDVVHQGRDLSGDREDAVGQNQGPLVPPQRGMHGAGKRSRICVGERMHGHACRACCVPTAEMRGLIHVDPVEFIPQALQQDFAAQVGRDGVERGLLVEKHGCRAFDCLKDRMLPITPARSCGSQPILFQCCAGSSHETAVALQAKVAGAREIVAPPSIDDRARARRTLHDEIHGHLILEKSSRAYKCLAQPFDLLDVVFVYPVDAP